MERVHLRVVLDVAVIDPPRRVAPSHRGTAVEGAGTFEKVNNLCFSSYESQLTH